MSRVELPAGLLMFGFCFWFFFFTFLFGFETWSSGAQAGPELSMLLRLTSSSQPSWFYQAPSQLAVCSARDPAQGPMHAKQAFCRLKWHPSTGPMVFSPSEFTHWDLDPMKCQLWIFCCFIPEIFRVQVSRVKSKSLHHYEGFWSVVLNLPNNATL